MRSLSSLIATRATAVLGVALLLAARSPSVDATAKVLDATGRELGVLTFADAGAAISVTGTLRGLAPGVHGVHLHAVGRCDGPDFASAGAHWSPTPKQHGRANPDGQHHGDLMNLTVGADSSVVVKMSTPAGSLRGEHPLLDADGAAIVIHATTDDYKTAPSGNSGARIACGMVSGS
ncbi:superoxide dismutase family protein [Gemmatimonas sp.]|jgi:Cu-Zn family superoxide dismutase|uniref:superoxide dismutase family protein n=1 Tax=Gemmatimonas sp. TaxID=1962908 RepID=UPI0037C1610A